MLFALIGFFVGLLGSMVGIGGGFLLVPLLMMFFPLMPTEQVTGISLFCVALNALSGSVVYWYRRLIHIKVGIIFALASLPGAWFGARLTQYMSRQYFEIIFALILLLLGYYLIKKRASAERVHANESLVLSSRQYALGIFVSFWVGFFASLFGIGGGIIHVPFMTFVLSFPVYLATGTSLFILLMTSLVAVIVHVLSGDIPFHETFVIALGLGIVVGAQVGAKVSKSIKGRTLIFILASIIILLALRSLLRVGLSIF